MSDDVRLRPVEEADLAVLDRFKREPDATGPLEWYGWRNLDYYRKGWADNKLLSDERGLLMVVRGAEPLGMVSWRKAMVTTLSHCWEIGIGLLPEARGKGYGTEAQRLIVRYLFAHSTVSRVQATTNIDNVAEQRSLEKVGFTREGVLRCVAFQNGRWQDGLLYSILRDEVPLG
ncbi:MAG TPA: GNAT family protein [Streptosporangiaceae bacterium]|jgi:RimJ/RimL family protein N-acetyltransferase